MFVLPPTAIVNNSSTYPLYLVLLSLSLFSTSFWGRVPRTDHCFITEFASSRTTNSFKKSRTVENTYWTNEDAQALISIGGSWSELLKTKTCTTRVLTAGRNGETTHIQTHRGQFFKDERGILVAERLRRIPCNGMSLI